MGGETKQDRTWTHVLKSLAARYGIDEDVEHTKTCHRPQPAVAEHRQHVEKCVCAHDLVQGHDAGPLAV